MNSLSLLIRVFYLPMQGMYLSYERLISCFQGDRKEDHCVSLAKAIF